MRHFLAVVFVLTFGQGVLAQDGRNAEIEATIQGQIDAFQVDDFATAFSFASPNIRRIFGDHANFGAMVRQGFPMVWRPGSVEFLGLREAEGGGFQKVLIKDQNGVFHALEYEMIQAGDGWLINGVQFLSAPGVAA